MKYIFVFLAFCLLSLIAVICTLISIVKRDDERAEMIIQRACTNTLCIMFAYLIYCAIERSYCGLNGIETNGINPFIQLSIFAVTYLIQLVHFKKKYGS